MSGPGLEALSNNRWSGGIDLNSFRSECRSSIFPQDHNFTFVWRVLETHLESSRQVFIVGHRPTSQFLRRAQTDLLWDSRASNPPHYVGARGLVPGGNVQGSHPGVPDHAHQLAGHKDHFWRGHQGASQLHRDRGGRGTVRDRWSGVAGGWSSTFSSVKSTNAKGNTNK